MRVRAKTGAWLFPGLGYNLGHPEWRRVTLDRRRDENEQDAAPATASDDGRIAAGLLRPVSTRFRAGELVQGRFRIVRLLGRGGMGEVYEAEDLQLGRIALKTIRPDFSISPLAYDRFRSEIQLARKVGGPQVCRIHELFLIPATADRAATAFLTMEFLDGVTLSQRLASSGPLTHQQALPLARDICEGLRLIHEQGIVHRDLKSSNIMLCQRNGETRAVLMDFGLAFLGDNDACDAGDPTVSRLAPESNVVAGTPAYMAPEQFEGKPVSSATDIYALGVVLYEMLTGARPYEAATPVGAAIRRARRPAPVSSLQRKIPHHWDRVIDRCLEYDPGSRYQSAQDVTHALEAGPLDFGNLRRDHARLVLAAAAVLLAAMAWGAVRWWQALHYNRPNAQAAYWYQKGLAALREGSYLGATRSLDNAVGQDSHFVMAHARLAEAWADLDFDGLAQREMLIATEGENHLAPLDHLYLDAIRATLNRDFQGALQHYREIFGKLPESEKPAGYVDVGMAWERAGNPQQALASYTQAEKLNPNNPAPFLRAAIVESHQNRVDAANHDFDKAEALYQVETNLEGQAELDYERGYLANDREDNDKANEYLNHARGEAQQIRSAQLEIRSLTQLSSVAYNSMHDDQAVDLAQKAIALARDNQLNSWAADGFVRLASAQLDQGHYAEADAALVEAFQILHQTQQSRVEALANLTLASLRNQQQRVNEISAPAEAALVWYKANGYFTLATRASLLLARADRDLGNTDKALREANELLALAAQAGRPGLLTQSEELAGSIYLDMENYPPALDHFQKALSYAGNGSYRPYELLDCANVLTDLGRFADAEQLLASAPQDNPFTGEIGVDALLMQREFGEASRLATQLLGQFSDKPDDVRVLKLDRAYAEASSAHPQAALAEFQRILSQEAQPAGPGSQAVVALETAAIDLAAGNNQQALSAARKAEPWFAAQKLWDSDLHSSLIAASAAGKLGDSASRDLYRAKTVDILNNLRNTWDPSSFQSYLSRPDLQLLVRETAHPPS